MVTFIDEPGTSGMTTEQEIAAIEVALDKLLRAAIEADSTRPSVPFSGLKPFSAAEFDRSLRRSKPARLADKLIKHPVGAACRMAVVILGERLHELGGDGLMRDVCDRVAEMDPDHWGKRTDIMDKRWDGIGNWHC